MSAHWYFGLLFGSLVCGMVGAHMREESKASQALVAVGGIGLMGSFLLLMALGLWSLE